MACTRKNRSPLARLLRGENGAALVEFALVLPIMLLVFAVIVESTRLMWSYQMAIEGVRDATRYVARTEPIDICPGGSFTISATKLKAIVEEGMDTGLLFPSQVTVKDPVTLALNCEYGSYRTDPAPIATVSADLTITFPLGGILSLFGTGLTSVTTTVTESSRIYGQ